MKTTLATLGLAALVVGVGCAKKEAVPTMEIEETFLPAADRQEMLNRAKLDPAPQPVRNAFLRQYPNSAVTNVEMLTAVTGQLIYRVSYVDSDGVPGMTMYTMEGTRIQPPPRDPALETAPPATPGRQ